MPAVTGRRSPGLRAAFRADGSRRKAGDEHAKRLLAFQLRSHRQMDFVLEHRFEAERGGRSHRFDLAFVAERLAIEVDGGIWIGGAHGSPRDIERNMRKGNSAVSRGWFVLHFTPRQVTSGDAALFVLRVLASIRSGDLCAKS